MGGVVKKGGIKYKAGMGPLCLLGYLPHTITIQDTLQVSRELALFYNQWKDEETELWNPWSGSRCRVFFKYLICNILLEFQEKALKLLLQINDFGRIYEPERSMININIKQLKTKDGFNEFNEKLEDPNERENLVIKQVSGVLSL